MILDVKALIAIIKYDVKTNGEAFCTVINSAQFCTVINSAQFCTVINSAQFCTVINSAQFCTVINSAQFPHLNPSITPGNHQWNGAAPILRGGGCK